MNDELDFTVQLLEDAVRCFAVKRGEFYADKNFGSRIRQSRSMAEALAYARQSVAGLDGVFVKSAKAVSDSAITFDVLINTEERQVTVDFGKL